MENDWSYRYARRQWSLNDNKMLKYHFMSDFDRSMLKFVKDNEILSSEPAWLLKADEENKTIVFERNSLIFVFNWGSKSMADYMIEVKDTGDYQIVFSTDNKEFGGFENINVNTVFPTMKHDDKVLMKIYNVSRTAVVYKRK